MAVTATHLTSAGTNTSDPWTIASVDVGSATYRAIVVIACSRGGSGIAPPTVSSVTFNGDALSQAIGHIRDTAARDYDIEIWYLVNPDAGSHDVVIDWTGGSIVGNGATVLKLEASNTIELIAGTANGADGLSTTPAVTITPGATAIIIAAAISEANNPMTSGDTSLVDYDDGVFVHSVASAATATATAMDWTADEADWSAVGCAFREAASGATNITPAEATQAQTSDAVSAIPIYVIIPAEAIQAQASDAALVKGIYTVQPAEATQAQTSDAATLDFIALITPAEATQAQTSDAAILAAIYLLTPSEATQAQLSDAAEITFSEPGSATNIAPAEAVQAQSSDAATITAVYLLTPGEAVQAQTSDAVTITPIYVITPAEAVQTQTSDAAVISFTAPTWSIDPAEAVQTQTSDAAGIVPIYVITVADAVQAQVNDGAIATVWGVIEHGERRLYEPGVRSNLNIGARPTHELEVREDSVFAARPTHELATRANLEVDDGD